MTAEDVIREIIGKVDSLIRENVDDGREWVTWLIVVSDCLSKSLEKLEG